MMAFPAVLLAIGITAALGPSVLNVIIALSVVYVPRTARIVRAQRAGAARDGVRAGGGGGRRRALAHPDAGTSCRTRWAPLIVQLSFLFAYAVLTEATLSFLGLGAVPPTPTWGNIMADGRHTSPTRPWIITIPGVALMLTVLGLNLLGDGLRDVLDPAAAHPAVSLLQVEGLTVAFRTGRGRSTCNRGGRQLHDGAGRDPGRRRRERQRQERDRAGGHGPAAEAGPQVVPGRILFDGQDLWACRSGCCGGCAAPASA